MEASKHFSDLSPLGTPSSCHLFYCPKWLHASPPHPGFWKNAEKLALIEALGFYASSTQL